MSRSIFTLSRKKGISVSKDEGKFQGQGHRMNVRLEERKLREIEHRVMCCLCREMMMFQ